MAAFTTVTLKILALVGFFVWLFAAHGWNWFTSGLFAISYAVFITVVVVGAIVVLWLVIVQVKESFDKTRSERAVVGLGARVRAARERTE